MFRHLAWRASASHIVSFTCWLISAIRRSVVSTLLHSYLWVFEHQSAPTWIKGDLGELRRRAGDRSPPSDSGKRLPPPEARGTERCRGPRGAPLLPHDPGSRTPRALTRTRGP